MKVALVHDYLVDAGGAERVLLELHRAFPDAPIFTSVHDPATAPKEFEHADVRSSMLLRPVATKRRYKFALPLYPLVFAAQHLRGYDAVISSASAFAKSVGVLPPARHVCYCYTPPRFVWQFNHYAQQEALALPIRLAVQAFGPAFRAADRRGARAVDRFVASSEFVRKRIRTAYGCEADVVAPPVDLERFRLQPGTASHFLVVSRLTRYKRIDIVVEAFNRLELPLLVVGTGSDEGRLRGLAGPTVRFAGRVSDEELAAAYRDAIAVVLPGVEDFGLAPIEANASGRPVIAHAAGGALETVVPGETGVLFAEQTPESLIYAIRRLQETTFDPVRLRRHSEAYSSDTFRERMRSLVERVVEERE